MRNVNYFLEEAIVRSQQGFEYVFADIIDVFDVDQTTLTTEDGSTMIINWNMAGRYKSHSIVDNRVSVVEEEETMLMKGHPGMVEEIISMLKHINVDGETMMEVLKQVGMKEQMLNQLMATMPFKDVQYEYGERFYAERCKVY